MTISLTGVSPEGSLSNRRLVVESETKKQLSSPLLDSKVIESVETVDVKKELMASTQQINQQTASNIEFSIDDESRRSVVKVVDGDSGEVLRQFPTEEALRIARQLVKSGSGLVQDKA
ncbi:MAG: flagellar biosynthesis protein FlaG [Acinetobacter sp.]|nr:flagellar biosynthesis protein FlaG [Acinetobacter sp.]MDO9621008.1 flagellar protein FlaG [Moraxellaceae bacterium]